jgi:hypothetical protein
MAKRNAGLTLIEDPHKQKTEEVLEHEWEIPRSPGQAFEKSCASRGFVYNLTNWLINRYSLIALPDLSLKHGPTLPA